MTRYSPEIIILRREIEDSISRKIKTPADFDFLSGVIWERLNTNISTSTLKRLWGYIDGTDTTRYSTITILARFLGYKNWEDFLEYIKQEETIQSDVILINSIQSKDLKVGDKLEMSWLPNRRMVVEYLGLDKFVIRESDNSKLCIDDTFVCSYFFKGQPLYIDDLVQGYNKPVAYIIGKKDGLTHINKL
jgi:hypothetical protein